MEISMKMVRELQDTLQMMDNWVNSLGREIDDNNARHVAEMREVLEALAWMIDLADGEGDGYPHEFNVIMKKHAHYLENK